MMLHIKAKAFRFFLAGFILLALANQTVAAQQKKDVYEDIFLYAQKLEQGGAYEQAELEYKRYIFLQDYSAGLYQTQAFTALSRLYEKNGQWELAAQTIQKAILSSANEGTDDTDQQLRIKHITFLENAALKTNKSLGENLYAFSYMNLPVFSDDVRQYAYLCAIENDLLGDRLGYAEKTYNSMLQAFPSFFTESETQTINKSFEKINGFKPKNQKLAGYLSFFPGLGQFYAGNYKDSLNAFLLNGSIIAVSAYSILTLDLWTFSLLELNPLMHFMRGNIYNAQKDAYEYNTARYQEYAREILDIVSSKKSSI